MCCNTGNPNKCSVLCKGLIILVIIFAPLCFFAAGAYYKSLVCKKGIDYTLVDISEEKPGYHTFRGTIKKDIIPPELELGDYWYNFYFDEPYLLNESAVGRPIYVKSLQIVGPVDGFFDLEDYVDKHVQVSAKFGWGYAESTTIEAETIIEL